MWNIDEIIGVEREESTKKPTLGKMGYQLGTTALISIDNYNAFRIRRIMLIVEILNNVAIYSKVKHKTNG